MVNPQINQTEPFLINLIPERTDFPVPSQTAAENCRYMKLKLGAMPFLIPSLTQDSTVLSVNCRLLYGKSLQERMISSPDTLSRLLLEEFGRVPQLSQEEFLQYHREHVAPPEGG